MSIRWCRQSIIVSSIVFIAAIAAHVSAAQNSKQNKTERKLSKVPAVVLEARELITNRRREEAIGKLLEVINIETNTVRQQELKDELNRLATLFLTDEGQRAFELANAMRFSGQMNFMPKYLEALKLEPAHWEVVVNQAVGYLILKNCNLALESATKANALNPFRFESKYLMARAQQCAGENLTENALREIKPPPSEIFYKLSLEASHHVTLNKVDLARTAAEATIVADKNYPMGYYWAWIANKSDVQIASNYAHKYLEMCKVISSQTRRQYYLASDLCVEMNLVENFIEGAAKQNEEN